MCSVYPSTLSWWRAAASCHGWASACSADMDPHRRRQCAFEFWDLSDAVDPLCGKPRDHHRSNYPLCCPFPVGSAGNSPGGRCRRECRDLARPSAHGSGCRQRRRSWVRASHHDEFHGFNRSGHGGSVRAYRTASVRVLGNRTLRCPRSRVRSGGQRQAPTLKFAFPRLPDGPARRTRAVDLILRENGGPQSMV